MTQDEANGDAQATGKERPRQPDTHMDNVWRVLGWSAFFAVGYGEVVMEYIIPRYYIIGCWIIAENKFCKEFLMQHGGAFAQWLAKKFG